MINPDIFEIDTPQALFLWTLWMIMNLIYTHKIINYDVDHPEKYSFLGNEYIIENIDIWPISKEMFSKVNSVDKITSKNFIEVGKMKFPDFDEKKFFSIAKKYFFSKEHLGENIIFTILVMNYFMTNN